MFALVRLALPLSLLVGVAHSEGTPDGSAVSFELVRGEAFGGHDPGMGAQAFDLVFADADLDGDPDLLINWHHLGPLEFYRNDDGVLRLADAGLAANAAAPGLFRSAVDAEAAAAAPGLYLWHDADPRGAWQFLWLDPDDALGGVTAELETSFRYESFSGLADGEVEATDKRRRTLTLPAGTKRRRFSVTTYPIGVQFTVRLRQGPNGTPPLYAGVPPIAQPGQVSLWKPDPHGMAWVDVEGSARPELAITRGALSGELLPPLPPKADRYFVNNGNGYDLHALPPGYGRGRGVEWVDVDNDGTLELSVANQATPNRLFFRKPEGFLDGASRLGLDLEGAGVQCWGDADGDGFQDLFHLDAGGVRVLLNRGGREFLPATGPGFDLSLPALAAPRRRELFDRASLRLADFDADGDLDLWVLGRGEERRNALFLREANGFVDATALSGVNAIAGGLVTVLADLDADGYEDLFAPGTRPPLWMNDGGRRLLPVALPFALSPLTEAAGAADVDGDGRVDLALVDSHRTLLMNRFRGTSIVVELRDPKGLPVGAVVTAVYDDGRRVARRLGSERSAFSQVAEPLRFPAGAASIEVVWPGERSSAKYPAALRGDRVVLERGR